MKLNYRRYGYLFLIVVIPVAVFLIVYFLGVVGLPGTAPELYRFIDQIKKAQISSPLLYLTTEESKDEEVEQLRRVAEKYSHRDHPSSDRTDPYVKKVDIGGSLRTALFAPAPSRFTFSVRVPEKAFLSFGYALIPDAWEIPNSATTFKIWLVKDRTEQLLSSDSIDPKNDASARRWFDRQLDLSSYQGEGVELVFETLQSAEEKTAYTYGLAVWSNPTLSSSTGKPSKPNVLLISIDTLRADHLSCYEYHRQTSPSIDKLAQEGVLFKNAFSQCSWTIPSHASIFTSKLPHRHGCTIDTTTRGGSWITYPWYPLPDSNVTLAEILRENGYTTAAFTSAGYMIPRNGLHQGFDLYYNNTAPRLGPALTIEGLVARTSNWLKRNHDKPFFLFFHTFEAHAPYIRHYFSKGLERGRLPGTIQYRRDFEYIKEATDAEKEYTIALYDGGIYHADRYIGMLLETLSQLGLSDNTIIVLTSDHGEEFWEHYPQRSVNHGHSGYDELLHVPLIFVFPEMKDKGKIIENQVRCIDIFPTILSALSIKSKGLRDKRGIDGRNLLPMIHAESETEDFVVLSEDIHCGSEKKTIRTKRYKYIYTPNVTQVKDKYTGVDFYKQKLLLVGPNCQEELYDLEKDPNETMNLALTQPELAEKFRRAVRKVFGIPTAHFLNSSTGRFHIRLEGITKRVETVIVQAMNYTTRSSSDGSLSMYNRDDVIDLLFGSAKKEGYLTYLIIIIYNDRTVERMAATRFSHSQSTEEPPLPTKEDDKKLLKQIQQLGYM